MKSIGTHRGGLIKLSSESLPLYNKKGQHITVHNNVKHENRLKDIPVKNLEKLLLQYDNTILNLAKKINNIEESRKVVLNMIGLKKRRID